MKLSMIAAMDRNNAIGKDNKLPWHLPADLANFKALTSGKVIIMGRTTWDSFGGRALPNRRHVVITRSPLEVMADVHPDDAVSAVTSIDRALAYAEQLVQRGHPEEVFVIGGAQVYHQLIGRVDTLYLSRIDLKVEGADAHFPEVDRDVFRVDFTMNHTPDGMKHTHRWTYQILNRITGTN